MHRRFEVAPGSQTQVDWGHEKSLPDGVPVYSFYMVLSYSRDPFCHYVAPQDLTTFWACHAAAFTHFGGVQTHWEKRTRRLAPPEMLDLRNRKTTADSLTSK